ncbi:MAG TPA: DUF2764 family protein [Thermodesulfovibrionia bacterium]|nr:DUF2764 family protein [Thermodesulfovibrionia bacterium]
MAFSTRYVMLITSLPYLPKVFTDKSLSVSKIQLEKRLTLLRPEDADTLNRVQELVHWDYLPIERTDKEIAAYAEAKVAELRGLVREIVQWRLSLRTVMAALRRRQRGVGVPDHGQKWGFGHVTDHIVKHWNEPDFGLSRLYPWVKQAGNMLANSDFPALEKLILTTVWNYLIQTGQGRYFDFEAVVLYVLRWNIMEQWAGYDSSAAIKRFDELVNAALKEHTLVFDEH